MLTRSLAGLCVLSLCTFLAVAAYAAQAAHPAHPLSHPAQEVARMQITSPDMVPKQPIPSNFTCDGQNLAPALNWSGVPAQAKSLVLVMDDPDAPRGTFVHWIVSGLPPTSTGLPQSGRPLPSGAVEVENSAGQTAYFGPCPPSGTHRYFFKLYALDVAELKDLDHQNYAAKLKPHILAQAELMGTYQRRR